MKELPKLTEEDINEIVKEHYGFSVEEADEMIGKLSLRVKQLEYNNEKLKHYKLLYQKVKDRNDKAIEFIESKNNGICIVNGEEKGAYTFLLDFDKSREFVWSLLEILKGNNE